MKIEEIPCNFVASFKVGDNLVYNCKVLCDLVEKNPDGSFNKPIILQVASILEASLLQIIVRAQNFNREGVPEISEADRQEIIGKKIDKFNTVIDVMKKYGILDALGSDIYDNLHRLRRFRNKVHIQDDINIDDISRDEIDVFSDEECSRVLALNKCVIAYLADKRKRPKHIEGYVNNLSLPTI